MKEYSPHWYIVTFIISSDHVCLKMAYTAAGVANYI